MSDISTPTKPAVDTCLCPLCGQSNACANEVERATGVPQGPCWCTTASFSHALLERVSPEARRLACICARCAATDGRNAAAAN
jgi:Cysteine-rich CWC